MSAPLTLPHARVSAFGFHSRILFHWRADLMRTTALGGEVASLVRAATATVADSEGVTRTVGHHQSRWTSVDTDGDSVRDAPALFLSRNDSEVFSWPFLARPQVMTCYVRFVEGGTIALASARVAVIGSSALDTPYLMLFSTGTFYRAQYHNGSVAVTATVAVAPTTGQRVELRAVLNADGSLTLGQSINEGTETTAVSSAPGSGPAIPAAWSAAHLWLNGENTTNAGTGLYRTLKIAAGVRSLSDMRTRAW